MRLFLCSSSPRGRVPELTDLLGVRRRVAVSANALDGLSVQRREWLTTDLSALAGVGADPFELDLRDHRGRPSALGDALRETDMVWATGGSVFLLIDAIRRSGLDGILRERLGDDSLTYGGCSAGACVCAPTLLGFDAIEDDVPPGGPSTVGMGLIPFSIAPHHGSSGTTGEAIDRLVDAFEAHGLPYRTLGDDHALVVRGTEVSEIRMRVDD